MADWKKMWLVHKDYVGTVLCNTFNEAETVACSWTNRGATRTKSLRLTKPVVHMKDYFVDQESGISIRRTDGKKHKGYIEIPGQIFRSDGLGEANRHGRSWWVRDAAWDVVDMVPTQRDAVVGMMSLDVSRWKTLMKCQTDLIREGRVRRG